ncbi:hypothetical protein DAPPUDRAFT_117135 [Daphnia pulex]|uniref:Retrovirus-related Pol polyprotein from transposon TNT 1-94-like beta-barrel domain-containing protein n=1 Tax=Daphnia pulex TaxID=6669 RepID=E9HRN4_DAPPU|nr:hypothetical protein DAPPUDRAFT_117135 [Daphnia pulex]|eukprot:EFX65588.1 hypothetical protein DAPPUDRAFT_117135 [Daphnia pulex]
MSMLTSKDISHIVKLDGSNFQQWKFGCRLLLESFNLLDIVDGVEKIPAADSNQKLIDAWKSKDVHARHYLFATIERQQQNTLYACQSANDIRGGRPGRGAGTRHPYIRKCNYCGDNTHLYATCRERLRNERHEKKGPSGEKSNLANDSNKNHGDHSYHSSTQQTIRNDSIWYADSGATRHMTDQRNILWNFKPDESTPRYVTGIGNTQLLTEGQGDVKATTMINGPRYLYHIYCSCVCHPISFLAYKVPHTYTLYTSTPDPVHISSLSFHSPLIDFNTLDVRERENEHPSITGSNIQREHLVLRTGDSNLVFPVTFRSFKSTRPVHLVNNSCWPSHLQVQSLSAVSSSSSQQLFVGKSSSSPSLVSFPHDRARQSTSTRGKEKRKKPRLQPTGSRTRPVGREHGSRKQELRGGHSANKSPRRGDGSPETLVQSRGSRGAILGLIRHFDELLLRASHLQTELTSVEDDEEAERQDNLHLTYVTRVGETTEYARSYLASREGEAASVVGLGANVPAAPAVSPSEIRRREQARLEEIANAQRSTSGPKTAKRSTSRTRPTLFRQPTLTRRKSLGRRMVRTATAHQQHQQPQQQQQQSRNTRRLD